MVKAVYGREEYNLMRMKEEVGHVYRGKLTNFVAAFTEKNGIDEEEAQALLKILENK